MKKSLAQIKEKILPALLLSILPILFIGLIFGSRIRDGLTAVGVLSNRIYERELYEFNVSICRDGSISYSQGRGTYSWHNGVAYKFYKGEQKKTMQECRIEAREISWIE